MPGFEQWLDGAARSDAAYGTARITDNIPRWIRNFERETKFMVNQRQVCGYPDGRFNSSDMTTNIDGTLPLIVETPYLFEPRKWRDNYGPIRLQYRPVVSVQRMRITLGPIDTVIDLPLDWLRVDKRAGEINLVPIRGTAQLSSMAAGLAMLTSLGFANTEYMPDSIAVDYVVGLPSDWATNEYSEWSDLKLHLADWCALQLLRDIDHVYGAGLANVANSADGLSQQLNYDRFQQKTAQLEARLTQFMETLNAQEQPFMMVWV